MGHKIPAVLTIAGSDCSGGAGIQADLKTLLAHGVYGMSAITALTAQNTTGVRAVQKATPELVAEQIDAVFEDIRPAAVKIGMLPSAKVVRVVAERLRQHGADLIVVDPVMVSTSGTTLMGVDATMAVVRELLPLARLVTPNIPEAAALVRICRGMDKAEPSASSDERDGTIATSLSSVAINSNRMLEAAHVIAKTCDCAVLVKGGHRTGDASDLLYLDGTSTILHGERIDNPNTHGTGCTLSSAIAANLAKGYQLADAVARAKDYLTAALRSDLDLGAGSGPLDHGFALRALSKTDLEALDHSYALSG